jgi:PDZ domain/Aspartyl protease
MKRAIRVSSWSVLVVLALGSCVFTPSHQVPAAAKAPVTIRADITGYGLIFLRAQVNNSQPLWFALDSGASFPFVIDARRSKALGLKLQDTFTLQGGAGAGAYEVAETKGVSVNLGDLKFADQTAAVIGLGSLEAIAGRALDGLVGSDLFTRYVIDLDYFGQKISLYDPKTYSYTGSGESIPLTKNGDYFFIPVKIEIPGRPRFEGRFLVDTGGAFVTMILNAPFARSKDLPARTQRMVSDHSLSGLGGEIKLLVSRAKSFTLGKLMIPDPVIYVSQDTGGALANATFDGVIGGQILRRFKVIFDYASGRLILEPNANYAEPVEYDMSGIRLRAEGDNFTTFRVYQVLESSPAAGAGLHEGDVLTAIDGVPAARLSLDEVYQMWKREGREYELSIRRGDKTFSVKLKMKRLV